MNNNKFCIVAQQLLRERMKHIQLADASANGWKMVQEYKSNPVASDSDDEKRILKAEARASRKAKDALKLKQQKKRRFLPYTSSARDRTRISPLVSTDMKSAACVAKWDTGRATVQKIHAGILRSIKDSILNVGNVTSTSSLESEDSVKADENLGKSPVGRLRSHLEKWKDITDDSYILDIVENGYKIPFRQMPPEVVLKNNKSARDNPDFVESEITVLLNQGVISETSTRPSVVNPLTVAYNRSGKPRLVLDCRHINQYLHLFNIKYEDIHVALNLFDQDSDVFVYDLKSAYHHIEIHPSHKTYLGFSWSTGNVTKCFIFYCLPFGIASAGHIFSKTLRCVVKLCRSSSHAVIMYLDDGIGANVCYNKAVESSRLYEIIFRI